MKVLEWCTSLAYAGLLAWHQSCRDQFLKEQVYLSLGINVFLLLARLTLATTPAIVFNQQVKTQTSVLFKSQKTTGLFPAEPPSSEPSESRLIGHRSLIWWAGRWEADASLCKAGICQWLLQKGENKTRASALDMSVCSSTCRFKPHRKMFIVCFSSNQHSIPTLNFQEKFCPSTSQRNKIIQEQVY